MSEKVNLTYCTNLVRFEYFDESEKVFKEMPYDSNGSINGFTSDFSATESIAGGSRSVKLRLKNTGLPDAQRFLIVKFDFSEAFTANHLTGIGYDSITDLSVFNSVTTTLSVGSPNQDKYHRSYTITSDLHSKNDASIVSLILSSNDKINYNNSLPAKIAVFPHMPKKDQYIPILLTVTLNKDYVEQLSQKRLSVSVPESFVEFNSSMSILQTKLFTSADNVSMLSNDENEKTFYPRYLGMYFNNDFFVKTMDNVTFPLYTHSLQYFANHGVKYMVDEYKTGSHVFERLYDSLESGKLPRQVVVDVSKPGLNSNNITYTGYTDARPLTEIMMELLGFAKYVYTSFKSHRDAGVNSTSLASKITRLESCLTELMTSICSPLSESNYSTYSGSSINGSETFFFNFFVRNLLHFVDWMRNEAFDDTTDVNYEAYGYMWKHASCVECYDPHYCFPTMQDIVVSDFASSPSYVALSMMVYSLLQHVEATYSFDDKYKSKFNRLRNNFVTVSYALNDLLYNADIFNPNVSTDGTELSVSITDLAYVTTYMALADQAMGDNSSLSRQPWHPANKHFRLRGVNSSSLTMVTNTDYGNIDLSDDEKYTKAELLQILADVDIISMMLYTVVDSTYSKQKSTTLSFKVNVTNY